VPLVVGSCLLAFFLAGIYRGQWRLISVSDVPSYALGVFGGVTLSLAVVTLITRFESGHSRSAYIIFGLLVFVALVGSRLSFRLLDSVLLQNVSDTKPGGRKPVLIYGAGKAGKLLSEEFMCNPQMKDYILLGFVDDDPNLFGRKLCGVPVKSGAEWGNQAWNFTPEIWVSSRLISDTRASQLVMHWNGEAVLRRLMLQMEPIDAGNGVTPSSSDALLLPSQWRTTHDEPHILEDLGHPGAAFLPPPGRTETDKHPS
jgi:FlaA1/EpsC-like NDP-sugar epimerase